MRDGHKKEPQALRGSQLLRWLEKMVLVEVEGDEL